MTEIPTLHPDYYLDNFHALTGHVAGLYDDLLNHQEKNWYQTLCALPSEPQRLYIRLLSRTNAILRQDKLHYPDTGDLQKSLGVLREHALVSHPCPDSSLWLNLLTKPELIALAKALSSQRLPLNSARKEALVEAINCLPGQAVLDYLGYHHPLIEVHGKDMLALFMLCYFGNTRQSLTDFIISELGHRQFEDYIIDQNSRYIQNRRELDAQLIYARERDTVDVAIKDMDENDIYSLITRLPKPSGSNSTQRRYGKLVNLLARQLERLGDFGRALDAFELARIPPARERCARINAKQANKDKALEICKSIIDQPLSDDELDFARSFNARLLKQKAPPHTPTYERRLILEQHPLGVEQAALEWYEQQGFQGAHCENSLVSGLFGLCFWDIIFAPAEGAFCHPYQAGPIDGLRPSFKSVRHAKIEPRLEEVRNGGWDEQRFLARFSEKAGIDNYFVHWQVLDENLLKHSLRVIPAEHLANLFERLLADPGTNRSGLPDLFLYRADEYRLVEVKGPGDSLQKNQRRWLDFFYHHNIPCEVCHVSY